jgi:nucleoprotein TPR
MEVEAKLKDSEAIPLFHAKQRLQTELESFQSQVRWLEQELQVKREDFQREMQKSRDEKMRLQVQLQHTEDEKTEATTKNTELTQIQIRLDDQVESLTNDLRTKSHLMIQLRQDTELELQKEKEFVSSQEELLTRWEERYKSLARENQSLKAAAAQAVETTEKDVEAIKSELIEKYEMLLKNQAAEYEARRAEQPVTVAALPASKRIDDDAEDEGPLGLTDVYERWEDSKKELREMKYRAERAEASYAEIISELEEKTPQMRRQRKEYEAAMDQAQDYQQRLEFAINEKDNARSELGHVKRLLDQMENRHSEQVVQTKTLAEQVQALLYSRAGGETSSGEIPTSVAEMQQQNQRLLTEHRKLLLTVDDLEEKLQTDELRSMLTSKERELEELQEERVAQEVLVEKIAGDLKTYKGLFFTMSGGDGSDSAELSIEEISRKQAEKLKGLQVRIKEMDVAIATLKGENDRLTRDKEASDERSVRFQQSNTELLKNLGELGREMTDTKGDLGRAASEAEYLRDKCSRLEEVLRRSKDEVGILGSTRSELQRINAELQQALSKERDLVSQAQSDQRQAEANLRRLQAELETATAAQRRLTEENSGLRNESASKGKLIESVLRIESQLSTQTSTGMENIKEENNRLQKQLADERKKLESEVENLKERLIGNETRMQEAEKSTMKVNAELISATNSTRAVEKEKQDLKVQFDNVESKLRAANKKLGITDESDAADVSLQARVDELSAMLRKSKEDADALNSIVDTYKKIAKDAEATYKELTNATTELQARHTKEVAERDETLESVRKDSVKRQEMILELTKDLAGQREEREQLENSLKSQISDLHVAMNNLEKDTESAKASASAALLDLETLRTEVSSTQDNYERELKMHSQARSALRAAREQAEEETRQRRNAEEKVANLTQAAVDEHAQAQRKNQELSEEMHVLEKRLGDSQSQNTALHGQFESLSEMTEKLQSQRVAAAAEGGVSVSEDNVQALQKLVSESREVIKCLRSESEMAQQQLDTATRKIDREKAAANVLRSSLDEVRAELRSLQDSTGSSESQLAKTLEENKAKLFETEDQLKLLRDSNKVLREETERLHGGLAESKTEIASLTEAAKPLEEAQHTASIRIAALEEEKASLDREVGEWRKRVESLVSKFNQIDPEEHEKALKRVEELEEEKVAQEKWKTTTEAENKRIREIARRLKQSQSENLSAIEVQKKEIEKLKEGSRTLSALSSTNADLKKERDTMKEKLAKLEGDVKSIKTQLEGATSNNDRLREMLRRFQKEVRELKAQKSSAATLATASATTGKGEPAQEKSLQSPDVDSGKADLSAEKNQGEDQPSGNAPRVPQGGFKFGPSTASGSTVEPVAKSGGTASAPMKAAPGPGLRAEAASFAPPTSKPEIGTPKPPAATPNAAKAPPPKLATSLSPTPPGSQPKTSSASQASNEMSMKEKLLEKRRKLEALKRKAEGLAKAKDEATEDPASKKARTSEPPAPPKKDMATEVQAPKKTHALEPAATPKNDDAVEQQAAKKARISEPPAAPKKDDADTDVVTTEQGASGEAKKTSTGEDAVDQASSKDTPDQATESSLSTDESKIADPVKEEEVKEEESEAMQRVSEDPPTDDGTKKNEENTLFSTAPNPFAASSTAFGTSGVGNAASLTTFGQPASFAPAPAAFGTAALGGAPAPAPAAFGTTALGGAPAPGAFGSGFLNMKPPGSATTAPTFSFGSSTGPIVLPTPSQTAPAPSPFGAFSGGGFGSGTSFGGSFASSSSQTFGSRPLFGTPQESTEEPKADTAKEDDEKEEEA